MDINVDVLELSTLLQCLGYGVKSVDTVDSNISQDGETRNSIVLSCQSSGLQIVLESGYSACSCPIDKQQNSGFWQVSGVTGGKHLDNECGSSLLSSLSKDLRVKLSRELREMVQSVRQYEYNKSNEIQINKSTSMPELKSPISGVLPLQMDTSSTRCRSLDTLTSKKQELEIPEPGTLQKLNYGTSVEDQKMKYERQSTYTVGPITSNIRKRNKTSSPIRATSNITVMEYLMEAERITSELQNTLGLAIKEIVDNDREDSSISSLALDVSKISLLKADLMKPQFASSPNLSAVGDPREDITKSKLKRSEYASTSNLLSKPNKGGLKARLLRLSPNTLKKRDEIKQQENKSKLGLLKAKIATPVHSPKAQTDYGQVSSSKKKYSHIKSTIPRYTPSKKE